ncbi:MAG: hypothetical protein KatS3mg103_0864 [Phycisphaerales bacterium]|nr:MAG: hypothetical protein KatS3mg103_0864 [Phycisphaerales bacterium]
MPIDSYKALCSDMYVNLKLAFHSELDTSRQATVEFFDRLRKEFPALQAFRHVAGELALESTPGADPQHWVAVRANCVRAGAVNPQSFDEAYKLHATVLELAPYYLGISPLDIDYYEALFGFDIDAPGDHDQIVFESLLRGSPLARLVEDTGAPPIDAQPILGLALREDGLPHRCEAYFEVKTRPSNGTAPQEPISVYLTVRRHGPMDDIATPKIEFSDLSRCGERLIEASVVPRLIQPIREFIASGGASAWG